MYKIVKNYIKKLEDIVENTNDGYLEYVNEEECINVRNDALNYLNYIFEEYNWSEEFVISFAVYCNFFILNGLYKVLNYDFALMKVYDSNNMNPEERQYLDYIYHGILEQNIDYFEKAVSIGLYDFDIPKYYIYLLSFLELCLRENEDFESDEGKEDILEWYCTMENAKKEISGELKKYIEPLKLTFEDEGKISFDYSILLPGIIITSYERKFELAANSDLDMLSKLSGVEIQDFFDIEKALKALNINSNINQDKIQKFIIFFGELIGRIRGAKEAGDYQLYCGKMENLDDAYLINRKDFLNLPVSVSENQYRNLALAKQLKLNFEKEALIQKNERMVEDFSHSVENIIKPALISEVANYLREDERNRNVYYKIMYIYYNEVITQNECRLLKMVHNVSVSKGTIRENISKSKLLDGNKGITIRNLVYKAINQIALQLSENSQKARFMFIMNKMSQVGIDSKLIDNRLWDSSKDYASVYKLFCEKLNFTLNIEDEVENICLNEEELGTSFIYTRIVELILNALTYGDYSGNINFIFDAYVENDYVEKYLIFDMTNNIGDRSFSNNRVGNGLNATNVMLERINIENPEKEFFVISGEKEKGVYVTRLYIDADLYI